MSGVAGSRGVAGTRAGGIAKAPSNPASTPGMVAPTADAPPPPASGVAGVSSLQNANCFQHTIPRFQYSLQFFVFLILTAPCHRCQSWRASICYKISSFFNRKSSFFNGKSSFPTVDVGDGSSMADGRFLSTDADRP